MSSGPKPSRCNPGKYISTMNKGKYGLVRHLESPLSAKGSAPSTSILINEGRDIPCAANKSSRRAEGTVTHWLSDCDLWPCCAIACHSDSELETSKQTTPA